MNTRRLGLVVCATASACMPTATVHLPNPMTGAGIPPHQVVQPDRGLERAAGLPPGTLAHEAALVALDKDRACFRLVLRVDSAHRQLADPRAWRATLELADDDNRSPIFFGSAPQQRESREATTTRLATRSERICNASGEECVVRDVVAATPRVTTVDVYAGGGEVCFANAGHITAATEGFTLVLQDPSAPFHRVAFSWSFR